MSPDEAFAAAVEAISRTRARAFIRNSSSSTDKTDEEREMLARRIEMSFADECGDVIRAALASLRASGYVVVPGKPTEARLYEIGGEISRMIEGRVDDLDMAMALYLEVISGAPVFPPEADHG